MGGRGFSSSRGEKFAGRAARAERSANRTARNVAGGGGSVESFAKSKQTKAGLGATDTANVSATSKWYDSIGVDSRGALKTYSGSAYHDINKALNNDKPLVGQYKAIAERIKSSFNADSATTKSMIMYRGANISAFSKEGKALLTKGAEFSSKGFTSMSHSRTVANDFITSSGGTLIRFKIPKGVRVAYLGNTGRSANPSEYEGILNSSTRFRVENVRRSRTIKNSFGEKQKVNLVTIRVLL